ncbi:MAG TPA: ATP-dependent helicase HrpB [Vicinamibacteria bacterium]|nr:ATP-dependent helicase HrpB [Vicinamibacteria bacterium]
MPVSLPIDPFVPEIVAAVRDRGKAIVVAPPGAGKTTRVPPALAADGPLILLQPRRVAARSLARRIAEERGLTLGEDVGWQVRFERRYSERTRLLVATEGILTARLQGDPLLGGFRTVVLDEFHERSLHADLALALARQAARARDDLRLVVMSATLDAARVAAFLDGAPVVEVPGRPHPVEIEYAAGRDVADAVRAAVAREGGHVLVFLPGAPEIRRAQRDLAALEARGVAVLPLHGSLPAEAQDAALAPSQRRRVILATNVAETSLTVEGVTDVIDTGLHKVLRYDPEKGLDRLETERISSDSAEQRAFRAGRTAPGRALRLWDARMRLRPHREPEIARVDLAGPVLDVLAWGGDPLRFEWFEAPPEPAVRAALELLERLGAAREHRLTPLGDALRRLPLHPRLGRVLLAAGASDQAAQACALLSERVTYRPVSEATDCDVLAHLGRGELPSGTARAAGEIATLARRLEAAAAPSRDPDAALRRALLLGFPDRVARRREPGSPRVLLSSGTGATLGPESGVRGGEFLVALDVGAAGAGEARVRMASRVEREWLEPTRRETVHRLEGGRVRAFEQELLGVLVLAERPVPPDPAEAERLLVAAACERGFGPAGEALLRRLRFAGLATDVDGLLRASLAGRTELPELDLGAWLTHATRRDLDRLAPDSLALPSGRRVRLTYRDDGAVVAAVKLQELFGVQDTPRLGPRLEPVLLELLAPNGRPVQTTRDLRSFWARTYPEVRRELRGRYPKHRWPEDPSG